MTTSASRGGADGEGTGEGSTAAKPTGPGGRTFTGQPDPAEPDLDRTEVFDILSNDRRLRLLAYLDRTDEERYAFRDLVDHVAARENDKPVAAITGAERNRVYSSMRQVHLPALDDAGVVEFDQRRNEVRVAAGFEAVRPYLGGSEPGARAAEPPWAVGYLLLAGGGTVAAGAAWATGAGVGNEVAAAALPLIALVALGHLARARRRDGRANRSRDVGGQS